jgi:hypothetical protein
MNKEKKIARRATRLVWGLVALLTTGVAQAALLVQERFDYPLVSPINSTQTNGVGFAALSSWGSVNANIVAGLGYTGYAATGNALQVTADSRIQRSLAAPIGGSTFYISMLINTYGVNGPRFGVELRSAEGPLMGRVINGWGIFAGQNGRAGISNSTGDYKTWTGVTIPSDSLPHLVVFKFDYAANAIKLYVDPLPALGEPATPSATLSTGGDWTINLNSDTWNAISVFRQGGANETLDEICIGTTWADVTPVNPVATTTDAWWTNVTASAGASWGDANNWVNTAGANMLPGPGSAFLTMLGASYTALYDSVQPAISNLTVENVAPYRTDLIVSAPLTHLGGAAIRMRAGSSITITNGGVWNYEGVNRGTDNGESMLSIRNGGELNVNGGLINFTNIVAASASYGNSINVGYLSTGTLRVASGRIEFLERGPAAFTNDNRQLRIGSGIGGVGFMEVTGGAVMLGKMAGVETLDVGCGAGVPIGSTKGTVIVSGGSLVFTNNLNWNLLRVGQNYGEGTFIITNTGYVNLKASGKDSRAQVGLSPFGRGLLRMTGGRMVVGDGLTAGYNNGYSAAWATGTVEVAGGLLESGSGFVIGYAEKASGGGLGHGTATITGGRVTEGYWGTFIGRAREGGVASGSMTITNGLFDIISSADPEATGTAAGNGAYSGLAVGVINPNEAHAGTRAWGELTISGSAVITNAGMMAVGVNGGTGTVIQTGGSIRHAPTGVAVRRLTVLGYGFGTSGAVGGGRGSYELSGGSYYTPNQTFIGGVPTNLLSYSRAGGAGLLKVTGGSFTVTNNTLMVGGHGTGTVTIGSNGVCFARTIVFTNNTQSTLRCELGTEGLGTLTASSNLVICAGAKLEVDTTAYQGKAVWVKLADCALRTGSFDPADITITGLGEVKQDRNNDQDIWLFFRRGTMIGIF